MENLCKLEPPEPLSRIRARDRILMLAYDHWVGTINGPVNGSSEECQRQCNDARGAALSFSPCFAGVR